MMLYIVCLEIEYKIMYKSPSLVNRVTRLGYENQWIIRRYVDVIAADLTTRGSVCVVYPQLVRDAEN